MADISGALALRMLPEQPTIGAKRALKPKHATAMHAAIAQRSTIDHHHTFPTCCAKILSRRIRSLVIRRRPQREGLWRALGFVP